MKIKKILALSAAVLMGITALSSCKTEEKSDLKQIGVVQITEHESLDTVRDSFTAKMKELGFVDGENCKIDYQSAQNEVVNNKPIVDKFKGDKKDIIIAIGTSTAQAAAAVSDTIPVVFAAITDPIAAQLVETLENPGKNVTGTSDALAVKENVDFALRLTPDIKTVGIIYNSGEVNSASSVKDFKEYFASKNLTVVEKAVTNSGEVPQAAQSLASEVDAIFTPNDNTIASTIQSVADAALSAKIPLYPGADSMVNGGGLAMVGADYKMIGEGTAEIAAQILNGEKEAKDIPVMVFNKDLNIYVNTTTAEKLGITLPEDVLSNEKLVKYN